MREMLFQDVKPGDKVAKPYSDGDVGAVIVTKVTTTQVVIGDERYRRDNGRRIGKVHGRILPWMQEHEIQSLRYQVGRRLVGAAKALGKVAANGWLIGYMPTDVEQANALADAIEKYVAAHPKAER